MISKLGVLTFITFAEAGQPSPNQLGTWLQCAAAVLVIAVMLKSLFVRSPSIDAHFATKDDLAACQAQINAMTGKVDEVKSEVLAAIERNRENTDEKITEVRECLARLDERTT